MSTISHKLDKTGLTQVWSLIVSNFVAKKQGKDLSTNDFTDTLKTKLDSISAGAEINSIESIAVNGTTQTPVNKKIDLTIPTGELASKDKISSTDFDTALTNEFAAKANIDEVSGAVEVIGSTITVSDAIEANAVDVSVDIESVQDLHGYDKPWVGGVGKNMLELPSSIATVNQVTAEILMDSDGNKIGVNYNGQNTDTSSTSSFIRQVTLPAGTYILSGSPSGSSSSTYYLYDGNHTKWQDLDGSGATYTFNNTTVCRIYLQVKPGITLPSNLKCYPMIRLASETDPTFEPYSNICPIHAVTETGGEPQIEIQRVGKNWVEDKINGYYVNEQGSFFQDANYTTVYGKVEAGKTYTITTDESDGFVGGFFTDKPTITSVTYNSSRIVSADKTFVAPIDGYVGFRTSANYATPQLELGSTATAYEPYQGDTYIIKTGQNVYGGTLDVTIGKLTVTHGYVDLGNLTWSYDSTNSRFSADIVEKVKPTESRVEYIPCSCYQAITDGRSVSNVLDNSIYSAANSLKVYVHDSRFSDATAFKNAVTRQTLVYELATPQTIQLTPTQVNMLKGTNTVSSNAQNINLTYLKDNAVGKAVSIVEKEYDKTISKAELKSKNLLPLTLDKLKKINTNGTWNGNIYSGNGYSFEVITDNDNQVTGIKANTWNNTQTTFFLERDDSDFWDKVKGKTCVLSGSPTGGEFGKYFIHVNGGDGTTGRVDDYGEGMTFTYSNDDAANHSVVMFFSYAYSAENLMFYPMISFETASFEPYQPSKMDLFNTKMNSDSIAPVENGDTASTSYVAGSYIVRNNGLYEVISAIASGATFTSNNIQQTTVMAVMAEILARL